jgi:hypothetical protein
MNVYVLIREDQNDHGFVDTSIEGVYTQECDAAAMKESEEQDARTAGSRVCGDSGHWHESDWQVYWKIEEHAVQDDPPARGVA